MVKKTISLEDREKSKPKATRNLITTFIAPIEETKKNSNFETEKNTEVVTKNVTKKSTKLETNIELKNRIKNLKEASKQAQTRVIHMGNKTIKVSTTINEMESAKRSAYFLREDTLEKIEICAKISGLKKAELVDFVLNHTLTEIINSLEK